MKPTDYIRLLIVVMVGVGLVVPALNFTVVIETGSFEPTEPALTQIARYWKKFPEKPLSHDPFLGKNIFSWVTHEIYLEIVSGKSPKSRPKIAKSEKSLEKVSGISPESPPIFWK